MDTLVDKDASQIQFCICLHFCIAY